MDAGNRNIFSVSLLFILYVSTYPQTTHAYIDLGTGSIIVQAVIAAIFGASFAVRMYWQKLKNFFGSDSKEQKTNDEQNKNVG